MINLSSVGMRVMIILHLSCKFVFGRHAGYDNFTFEL